MAGDPWTMTMVESQALPVDLDDRRSPIWQFVIAQSLTARRGAIEAGGGHAVLGAVAECLEHGLTVPAWLTALFLARHKAVERHLSWDAPAVFGPPHPAGTHLKRVHEHARAAPAIFAIARAILAADPAQKIDQSLYEEIADRLGNKAGLSWSQCRRILSQARPKLETVHGPLRSGNQNS